MEIDPFVEYTGSDLPLADPPPEQIPPGMQYHERLGLFPVGCDVTREIACRRKRWHEEQESRRSAEEYAEEERARLAALPPPPPTLEERVAELERQVAHLQGRRRAGRKAA